ncbi:hypothetical protein [Georgenia alba]|uniref:ABC transmembrane type-1 domain-containing protein n=1 Tax=Georgenia alba TaxID=2233858 RepID=A0ABW2Q5S1_9MICO
MLPGPAQQPGRRPGVLRAGWDVIADAFRLIGAHWPMLLLLAIVSVVAREYVLQATVLANRTSVALSQLVLALAPLVQLLTVVGMLLTMRSRMPGERVITSLVVGSAAAMLPFLVIYEHYGYLDEDVLAFGLATFEDLGETEDITTRLPQGTSAVILVTIAVALSLRQVLTRLVRRTPPGHEARRSVLRLVGGYCEVVWLVLAAWVVKSFLEGLAGWWRTRSVGVAVEAWWRSVSIDLPELSGVVTTVLGWFGTVADAALAAFVVPLAWLAVAGIVYGVHAERVLRARDLRGRAVTDRLVGRLGDDRADRGLRLLTDPERRFGGVVGAGILIARAGWQPVLLFCLAFLAADRSGTLLFELARLIFGARSIGDFWALLWPPLDMLETVVVRVLTLALVASAIDSLLRSLGLPGSLRLQRSGDREPEVLGAVAVGPERAG